MESKDEMETHVDSTCDLDGNVGVVGVIDGNVGVNVLDLMMHRVLDRINEQFNILETHINKRFDDLEERLDELEKKVDNVGAGVDQVCEASYKGN